MSAGSVLVVDDEPDLRSVYELALVREGYDVDTAGSVEEGKKLLAQNHYHIMITDMCLPDGMGLELVKLVGESGRAEKCLVVTAYGSAENAVEALKAGAFDYLTKPVNLKQLRKIVADVVQAALATQGKEAELPPQYKEIGQPKEQVRQGAQTGDSPSVQTDDAMSKMLGHSAVMQQVRDIIKRVASTMAPVLVRGESGTGKELVARGIHQHSHRARGAFIAVNCGAIPENLMEAEFFGYRKGAFTGANEDRVGLFASAAGGTLFLDEIGELPLQMQAKLLRVIQERAVRPLGAHEEESVDVRIISATHRNLAEDVKNNRFRQDLYYRLNVIEVLVPPLRKRKEDIEEIAQAILTRICYESALPLIPIFEPKALGKLKAYNFPGNVRELENILQRAVAMCDGSFILEHDLLMQHAAPATFEEDAKGAVSPAAPEQVVPPEETQKMEELQSDELPPNLSKYMDNIEREKLVKALEMHNFNRTAAAAQLGLSLRQIRYRMERLNIDVPDNKE